jgi:sensor histidine kinase YesM
VFSRRGTLLWSFTGYSYIRVMQNPFAFRATYAKAYWFSWILIANLYALILRVVFSLPTTQAVIDALVFCLIYALIGLIIWNVVHFSGLEKDRIVNTLITHVAASGLLVFAWTFFSQSVLKVIFPSAAGIYEFNSQLHYFRMLGGAVLYVFIALLYYLTIYYEEYQKRKLHEAEIEKHLKVAELNMLKAQINPHFIFNALNSISSLTLTDSEKAHEMVITLADYLRYSIGKNSEEQQSLNSEVHAIELYLSVERVRYGDRLQFDIDCDKTTGTAVIPALLLQPLIENAVKYGTHESTTDNNIRMTCRLVENVLEICIINKIEKASVPNNGQGIGLQNVRNRLALFYGRHDLLETIQNDDIFEVKMKIPQL